MNPEMFVFKKQITLFALHTTLQHLNEACGRLDELVERAKAQDYDKRSPLDVAAAQLVSEIENGAHANTLRNAQAKFQQFYDEIAAAEDNESLTPIALSALAAISDLKQLQEQFANSKERLNELVRQMAEAN